MRRHQRKRGDVLTNSDRCVRVLLSSRTLRNDDDDDAEAVDVAITYLFFDCDCCSNKLKVLCFEFVCLSLSGARSLGGQLVWLALVWCGRAGRVCRNYLTALSRAAAMQQLQSAVSCRGRAGRRRTGRAGERGSRRPTRTQLAAEGLGKQNSCARVGRQTRAWAAAAVSDSSRSCWQSSAASLSVFLYVCLSVCVSLSRSLSFSLSLLSAGRLSPLLVNVVERWLIRPTLLENTINTSVCSTVSPTAASRYCLPRVRKGAELPLRFSDDDAGGGDDDDQLRCVCESGGLTCAKQSSKDGKC